MGYQVEVSAQERNKAGGGKALQVTVVMWF